ncbi:D-alanine--D-alanine ligase family protein [Dickeya dianthicola]|uniref:D-alanine--D-alanine ligase family protein n=1 Tax=Dickeya dianthicola TaxID=204039 RepID=UPI00301A7F6F
MKYINCKKTIHVESLTEKEKRYLLSYKEFIKNQSICLVEGTHSQENLIYKSQASDEERGITSIESAFIDLGLNYKKIESTDNNLQYEIKNHNFVFIYAHGEYGEDGRLQGFLDYIDKPYPGSGVLASAVCCDKLKFKYLMTGSSVNTPNFYELNIHDSYSDVHKKALCLQYPIMAKERCGGSSLGITYISNDEDLHTWYEKNKNEINKYFLEKFISGRIISVGFVQMIEGVLILPTLETVTNSNYYDAELKIGHSHHEVKYILNSFSSKEYIDRKIKETAIKSFEHAACQGVGRVDLIIDDNNDVFILEINTIPGISKNSNFTKMFTSLGFSYNELVIAFIRTGILKKENQGNKHIYFTEERSEEECL